jgi:lipoate-protein ligase A|tara:strand:+ start:34775 stop:35644 length:870 start_codon:yes stop_codon:yes gene_type:complete
LSKTKLYISPTNNPFENLALEEWALQNFNTQDSNLLILYVNEPCVVVGRNQNIFEEVNVRYCSENQIEITRRISGGGTVFHDLGNLNWTHITSFDSKKVNSYEWAAKPIIDALKGFNLDAYLTDRNAIEISGLKVSGQAQFTNRKNILSHGTLLIDSELVKLQRAIEVNPGVEIQSKASPSHRSQTVNLSKLLNRPITPSIVVEAIRDKAKIESIDHLPAELSVNKFKSYAWIYERSPKFIAHHEIAGEKLLLQVEKATIKAIKDGKGHLLQDHPFLNQTYKKFLNHYS